MATITVGPGQQFATINAGVRAAAAGDTVAVSGGAGIQYTNDFIYINKPLTLQAVGGMVKMVATSAPPNGKAMIITGVRGTAMTINIRGFDVSGVRVGDQNGAAVRYEGGTLNLSNVYFHHNQEGILAGAVPGGRINIDHSEFAFNGVSTGRSHNIYVNQIAELKVTNSYIHDAIVGHEIKSRALNTIITGNRIFDNAGTSSYSIDLPSAGNATISGNMIQQGPNSQNFWTLAYATEGATNAGRNVQITGNTFVNDRAGGRGILNRATTPVTYSNNREYAMGADSGLVNESGTMQITRPMLNTAPIQFIVGQPPPPPPPPPPTMTLDEYHADVSADFFAWSRYQTFATLQAAIPILETQLTSTTVLGIIPGDVWSVPPP